jgi:hypothetical protein
MSKSVFRHLKILSKLESKDKLEEQFNHLIFGGLCTIHAAYCFLTLQENTIIVKQKYQITRGGFTELMIVDDKNIHRNVNNSFWFFKWDSLEDYQAIEESNMYKIRQYGFRIPFLGVFPNVIKTTPLN